MNFELLEKGVQVVMKLMHYLVHFIRECIILQVPAALLTCLAASDIH
jgi:hypothetical protein